MSTPLIDRVEILQGRRSQDRRGWLHVPLGTSQLPPGVPFGEVYVIHSVGDGQRRGDHLHRNMHEWFCVVMGSADLQLVDPATRARRSIRLNAGEARTVSVPAGLAHCLVSRGGPMTAVVWASREHDEDDVVPFRVEQEEPV